MFSPSLSLSSCNRVSEGEDGSGKQPGECNSKTSNSSSGSKDDRESEGEQDAGSQENEGGTEPKDGISGKQPGEGNSKTSNSSSGSKEDRESEENKMLCHKKMRVVLSPKMA